MNIHFGAKDVATRPEWRGQKALVRLEQYDAEGLIETRLWPCEITDVQPHHGKTFKSGFRVETDRDERLDATKDDQVDLLTLTPVHIHGKMAPPGLGGNSCGKPSPFQVVYGTFRKFETQQDKTDGNLPEEFKAHHRDRQGNPMTRYSENEKHLFVEVVPFSDEQGIAHLLWDVNATLDIQEGDLGLIDRQVGKMFGHPPSGKKKVAFE